MIAWSFSARWNRLGARRVKLREIVVSRSPELLLYGRSMRVETDSVRQWRLCADR
jgi:hypothetical protein